MGNKILIAEDEAHIARLIAFKLQREGFEVSWAPDGGAALDMVRRDCPDCVVLDVMMPVMDGFEVLKRIKEDPVLAVIPVIMLTAQGREDEVVRGLTLGSADYLIKPFRPAELIARIRRFLKN